MSALGRLFAMNSACLCLAICVAFAQEAPVSRPAPSSATMPEAAAHAAENELLKQLGVLWRANMDSIRTWQGEVTRKMHWKARIGSAEWDLHRTMHIDYAFAHDSDKYIFLSNCVSESGKKGHLEPDGENSYAFSVLRRGSESYEFGPWYPLGKPPEPPRRPTLFIKESSRSLLAGGVDFDPFYFMRINGINVDEAIALYIGGRNVPGVSTSVSRNGMQVVMSHKTSVMERPTVYVFSFEAGGNPIEVEYYGPSGYHLSVRTRFERVGNVWVPDEAVYVHSDPARATWKHATFKWVHNVVNEPLPKDAFSLHRLGVRKGDRVFDRRTNVEYTFDGEEETTVAAAGAAASRWPWVVGTGSAAVLLALLGLWLRRRSRGASHASA